MDNVYCFLRRREAPVSVAKVALGCYLLDHGIELSTA